MKIKMKMYIAMIIALVLSCGMVFSASSLCVCENVYSDGIDEGIDDYIDEVIGGYLYNHYASDFALSCYKISNVYSISNHPELPYRICFVFKGNMCIGELDIAYKDGQYYSVYYDKSVNEVSNALKNGYALSVCYLNGEMCIVDEVDEIQLSGDNLMHLEAESSFCQPITLSSVDIKSSMFTTLSARSASVKTLNVPIVATGSDPYNNGAGLCWAACAASIIGYKTGTSLTSTAVYNKMIEQYGLPSCGYFAGSDVRKAFSAYGIGFDYTSNGMNYAKVRAEILRDNPIYAGLRGTMMTGSGEYQTVDHAVVICGYMEMEDGLNYYTIMDPNKSLYATSLSVSSTTINLPYIYEEVGKAEVVYSQWVAKGLIS